MGKGGKYLKNLRLEKGLSIDQVSQMTDREIDNSGISRIETGQRGVSLKAGFFFAQIYGVSMEDIAKMELGAKARIKKIKIEKKKPGRKKK